MRHSCAPPLPALITFTNHHRILIETPNTPFVIPGFQEWSAEPQIPRLRSGRSSSCIPIDVAVYCSYWVAI
jgi:hypothetical protein